MAASKYKSIYAVSNVANPALIAPKNVKDAAFTAEVVINDYPQHARWKVTSKENIKRTIETTGASVTVRGQYIPPVLKVCANLCRARRRIQTHTLTKGNCIWYHYLES